MKKAVLVILALFALAANSGEHILTSFHFHTYAWTCLHWFCLLSGWWKLGNIKKQKLSYRSTRPNISHFCGLKNSSIEAWGSQATSIEALESQTQHKNNCFSVKAKFKLFFRQTSLHQNVKHLVGYISLYIIFTRLSRAIYYIFYFTSKM